MIPSGTVTFLFTDIESSTKLSQEYPELLGSALEKHNCILNECIKSHNGFVFLTAGDSFCSAFTDAADAVTAAYEIQRKLAAEISDNFPVKVRIGIHSGKAEWSGNNYMGYVTLARANRVMSSAYGEQIIISNDTYQFVKNDFGIYNPEDNSRQEDESYVNIKKKISFRDLGERRLKDLINPLKLFQLTGPGIREDFPPLKTLDARPNNLPVQLTSFIGREEEMLRIKNILKQNRLLTIIGSGGAGKTRLSMQTAADVIDDFGNGVWLVELDSLFEPELLPQTIAHALGINENPEQNPESTLFEYIKEKELLVILDNCEHIIQSVSQLTEKMLQVSPGLKIISTSREALRCSGEITHRVKTLESPDPKQNLSAEKLSQFESVRLFIERALAVNSNFRVNNKNAAALAGICHQLDGIPLAIELAAARTKVLQPEKIYERLNDRFRLLTGGKRTALPRQQTLKAMIDWSYELLSENEKILLRRLSVFPGGFTLEDAEEICADDNIPENDILDLVYGLTEKSIVIYLEEKDRYKMLETIRQYGEEKLRESDESKTLHLKHLNYYLKISEKAEPELTGPKTKIWFKRFDNEHSNIQAALSFSAAEKFFEEGNKILCSLGKYWEMRGFTSECKTWLERLMVNPENISPSTFAKSNKLAGIINTLRGQYNDAEVYLLKAYDIYRENDDKPGMSATLNILGLNKADAGDYKAARNYIENCLSLLKNSETGIGIANLNNSLGLIHLAQGNYEDAKIHFTKCLTIAKELEDEQYQGIGINNLAQLEAQFGNYDPAEKLFLEGLEIEKSLGNQSGIAISLVNLGSVALEKKDFTKAKNIFNESLGISREVGFRSGMLYSLGSLGQIALFEEDFEKSKSYYRECLNLQKSSPEFQNALSCITGIVSVKLMEEKTDSASELAGFIGFIYETSGAAMEETVREHYNKLLKTLRIKSGNETAERNFEKGKLLTLEKAIELALSDL